MCFNVYNNEIIELHQNSLFDVIFGIYTKDILNFINKFTEKYDIFNYNYKEYKMNFITQKYKTINFLLLYKNNKNTNIALHWDRTNDTQVNSLALYLLR